MYIRVDIIIYYKFFIYIIIYLAKGYFNEKFAIIYPYPKQFTAKIVLQYNPFIYIYMYTFDSVDLIAVKNACIHIPLTWL